MIGQRMNHKKEYERWLEKTTDQDLKTELERMDADAIEDAFYRDLAFGTGGLRGIIGAGTNRMNVHVVAKASQGLANYLLSTHSTPSVVVGYDSRIKSDVFAKTVACVLAANGIKVWLWSQLLPVSTVSFAIRKLRASAGVMITASHNPGQYNGYKVYNSDGCQITTETADAIFSCISSLDIFTDVNSISFDEALAYEVVEYIDSTILTSFIEAVKSQSVLYGDEVNRDVAIVYSPLNGTGLKPLTRVLKESGFTNITVVEEQRHPDGSFPTCQYPNPENEEAMKLGLQYMERTGADLLIATDPDCDRCGIAVRDGKNCKLLTGNEVGLLLLDFICSQRIKHHDMPTEPLFVKTIVTIDLAKIIADHFNVKTINVLTGFKFIGEVIGLMEDERNFICGFEESYGYLIGSYVRDKDAVGASFMICEMFAFYKTRNISLIQKLEEIYATYGYCLNTLHFYEFPGRIGMEKMIKIMSLFHIGLDSIGGMPVIGTEDYSKGINGLPQSDVLKFFFKGPESSGSVVVRPSGTEPKLKTYISVSARNRTEAEFIEAKITSDLEAYL